MKMEDEEGEGEGEGIEKEEENENDSCSILHIAYCSSWAFNDQQPRTLT
jgi:hypothetical protein